MKIPLVDLKIQYQELKGEILETVDRVFAESALVQGPYADTFAKEFLRSHGLPFGVGCSNGTSAITLVLRALGVSRGDEVLVPNNTFIGTVEPIVEVGAKPVFVDVDPESGGVCLVDLAKKRTAQTKAVIAVHLYGNPDRVDLISEFCDEHQILLLEDCAQAHLAKLNGKPVGSYGAAATFSFYPGKNLGAYGDAGFVAAMDSVLIDQVKKGLDHGRKDKYLHEFSAGNFRMDGIQAAILSVKLKRLPAWTLSRRQLAQLYGERLSKFRIFHPSPEADGVYHLLVVEVSNRDEVQRALSEVGIATGVHYPVPMSLQPAFKNLGHRVGDFPVSERMAERILSLPLYPELSQTQVHEICDHFLKVAKP